jgi:hypothetical protein
MFMAAFLDGLPAVAGADVWPEVGAQRCGLLFKRLIEKNIHNLLPECRSDWSMVLVFLIAE